MRSLTAKQITFANVYVQTGNKAEAYRLSYRCDRMSQRTIWRKGQLIAGLPHVAERIHELQSAARKRCELTVDDLVEMYWQIANADISDFVTVEDGKVRARNLDLLTPAQKMCIKRLRQGPYGVEIELHDKMAALHALAKHLGMFTERHRHELAGGFELNICLDREQLPMTPAEISGQQTLDD